MKKILLCGHTGSNNRGCEAIVLSTAQILKQQTASAIYFTTFHPKEDVRLIEDDNINGHICYNLVDGLSLNRIRTSITSRISKDYYDLQRIFQKRVWWFLSRDAIAINVGGDTYCYARDARLPSYALNRFCFKSNIKNIFWCCSIEEKNIDTEMITDLNHYSLIIARESISYNNLLNAGISVDKLRIYPDPAFTLQTEEIDLPAMLQNDIVGINLSPLVVDQSQSDGIVLKNFDVLIDYVLQNSQSSIALIPHVYYDGKQDVETLSYFYRKYKATGRVYLFQTDLSSRQLKYIISKCRFFVAARTHASIAAYSSCVPTLVVGYSVKSEGIARDIFGTSENYVLPVSEMKETDDLLKMFTYIEQHETVIISHLQNIMPEYIKKAWRAGLEISNFIQ